MAMTVPAGCALGRSQMTTLAEPLRGLTLASLEDFAQKLAAFPLSLDAPIELAGRFADQEQVGIRVTPVGAKGQISVAVHLATPRWPDTRPDAVHDVRLELLHYLRAVGATLAKNWPPSYGGFNRWRGWSQSGSVSFSTPPSKVHFRMLT